MLASLVSADDTVRRGLRRYSVIGEETPRTFAVHIEPGGHVIQVRADGNILAAALAAGLPLPHSCREGRCGSCKAKLLAGGVEYPADVMPAGIAAAEAAAGEILLCQARPRSELRVVTRRMAVRASAFATCRLLAIEPLPLGALRVRLAVAANATAAKPGQFVDVRSPAGDTERLPVIERRDDEISVECADDGSGLRRWLEGAAAVGAEVRVSEPFDRPR